MRLLTLLLVTLISLPCLASKDEAPSPDDGLTRPTKRKRSYYRRNLWRNKGMRRKNTGVFLHGFPGRTMGVGMARNISSALRLHGSLGMGWGGQTSTQVFMGGAKLMMPNWSFTPFLDTSLLFGKVGGQFINPSGAASLAVMGGLDWQFRSGLNIGAGAGRTISPMFPVAQVYLGYYF